jgi:hypothetical protein
MTYYFIIYIRQEVGMTTKLTLRVDEALIDRAKKIARLKGVSLSRFVSDYFQSVTEKQREKIPESPILSEIAGILSSKKNRRILTGSYKKHIKDKYL